MQSKLWQTERFLDSYRAETEDRAVIVPLPDGGVGLILADGAGGRANGGAAATRTVTLAETALRNATPRGLARSGFYETLIRALDRAERDCPDSGETTLVVVVLSARHIVGASVGDSEAWWVASATDCRVVTENQHRKTYIGSGMTTPVAFSVPVPRAGTLLMATDGLFKYADPDSICRVVAEGGLASAAGLGELARGRTSGKLYDDLAVLLAGRDDEGTVTPGLWRRITGVVSLPPGSPHFLSHPPTPSFVGMREGEQRKRSFARQKRGATRRGERH